MRAAAAILLLAAGLGGCDVSMKTQPKDRAQAVERSAPAGSVAQDDAPRLAAERTPPPVTAALVARGRDRHDIACKPCHGATGEGDGAVVQRGFPKPLPYTAPRLMGASAQELYGAITDGYGLMYPQAGRLPDPADRWAVVAYIRALQLRGAHGGGGA